jgi:hypothetical protein
MPNINRSFDLRTLNAQKGKSGKLDWNIEKGHPRNNRKVIAGPSKD